MPNFAHLKHHFSNIHGIPFDDIIIFKYYPQIASWIQLTSNMKNNTSKKKKLNNSNSKTENIILPPYSLRDGDVLAVLNSKLMNKQIQTKDIYIDRLEDVYIRWLKRQEDSEKKFLKVNNMKGGKKKQIVEVSLKFGGDLDFSDEETDEIEVD